MSTEDPSDQSDMSLPIDVHFPDERLLTVDFDAAVRRGLRMRRNKKVVTGAVAAAVVGVLGASAAYLAPTSSPSTHVVNTVTPTGSALPSILRNDGPALPSHLTILDSKVNPKTGFTLFAVAWLSGGGPCFGAVNQTSTQGTGSTITCSRRPAALSATRPTVLAPQVVPDTTDDMGSQMVIGFVTGDVTKVSLKIRGQLYNAAVATLYGSPTTGAYMVWVSPANGVVTGAQDFTQITGYDARGATVVGAHP